MRVRVTHFVSASEFHNFLNRDVEVGTIFTVFEGSTFNCVDEINGIALTESDDPEGYPFFEFPRKAVEVIPEELIDA